MKHMQHTHTCKRFFRNGFLCCCMCILSLITVSCISLPGEKEAEQQKLAVEYYDIALKYVELKQYDKAVSCFEKAREKADSADWLKIDYQLARTYAFYNKWDKSSELFGALLEVDSDNSNVKEAYAYTLYKNGDKEKALQLYAELGKSDPFVSEETNQEAIGS